MTAVQEVLARATEGFIDVPGGKVWYQSVGDGEPLLLLHGGPGGNCIDLESLMTLSLQGYQVVRYDQLGSGRSDQPDDPSLWTVERFLAELETVRNALGFDRMHLLGQSWGAILALEYALHFPDRLGSQTLYSGASSIMQCYIGMQALRDELPPEMVAVMNRHEAAGNYEHPDYLTALQVLYDRHFCRVQPWPDELTRAMESLGLQVYHTMWGPNEFTLVGNLASWDRRDRLGEIEVPTLIVCGRYDEVIPACSETMHAGIRGSRLRIFEDSSHHCHLEEPEKFFPVLIEFLMEHPID